MQAFIRHGDAVAYEELLAWHVPPDRNLEYGLYYIEADLAAYREAVRGIDTIVECRIDPVGAESAHVWACETTRDTTRSWRGAFADRALVVVPPVRFDDDAVLGMTLVGEGGDVQAVLDGMPSDVELTVDRIGPVDRPGGPLAGALTARQLEAVTTAFDQGYYEVPRRADLAGVADTMGCAESTASQVLRRAERGLVAAVIDRYAGRGSVGR